MAGRGSMIPSKLTRAWPTSPGKPRVTGEQQEITKQKGFFNNFTLNKAEALP